MRVVPCQRLVIILAFLAAFTPSARGELVFEVLYSLPGVRGSASSPRSALIEATDGSFYGTTAAGGEFEIGTVFVFDPPGGFRILHSFTAEEGYEPHANLIEASDGNFYGTATFGGAFGAGSIFKVSRSGDFTTVYSFDFTPPSGDGSLPSAALIEASDGNFYGTTATGGEGTGGTVFKITPSGALTVLHSFSLIGPNGANSGAALIEASNGTFYGTAAQGGKFGFGTLFRIDDRGRFSALISFDGANGGVPPAALCKGADGNLYGTTAYGGEADFGTIYKITPTGSLTTLHSFRGDDGSRPTAALIEASDGSFYGTTTSGGKGDDGTVFKITPTGVFTSLHSFDGLDGMQPDAALIEASDGSFYGTTLTGGLARAGVVFRLRPSENGPSFLRGDCNHDGRVEGQVTDAVFLLNHNFLGGLKPDCLAACDANGDGSVLGSVTDAVYLLKFNFLGGTPPVHPFPLCGTSDVETDAALGCDESTCP